MFSRETITFLRELDANNNRDWFADNKERYEAAVRAPALAFIEAMEKPLVGVSPYFTASAKKVGGSLMRVYRDTRFSKDKTPYKTNIGIQFRHVRGKDVHAPGFYLHIEPTSVFVAAGTWHTESATLTAIRTLIDEYPNEWQKLVRKVTRGGMVFWGESLKRPPRGFDKDHPMINDLKRKDFILTADLPISSVYGKSLLNDVTKLFKAGAPLVKFICEADDLAF